MNDNTFLALLLSFFAGISTVLGAIIVLFSKKKSDKTITFALGFSAGVMICVSFTDLFPHAEETLVHYYGNIYGVLLTIFYMLTGVIFAMLIDKFVPHEPKSREDHDNKHLDLFRVGFVSMIAITLHNFPEGIATFMSGYQDITLGVSIAVAIALHNIPEGIAVAMPIYYSTGSRKKAFKYTLYSGLSEPLGALIAFLILKPFINDFLLGLIFAFVMGIMLYISFEELIPSSRQYGYNNLSLYSIFLGICIMPLTHIFLK
ncbi:zinc transporter ZupT [Clostridium uliginosum]|uniref:Zinc transporter, ZIP family n=1 Tax=Clostridium uliginosum TaxID=119641 RepID=A0A1I1NZP6_9CLOT|nr:zinc transporter ZupT [Clostridium uliginosum]SFD00193.1 zinc transporter, ZIP family [Clostridium uliginosum]